MTARTGAIVTVGTELVRGLALDTNTAEIAHSLLGAGIDVLETASVGDDETVLAGVLARLTAAYDLVVVTGGLGPTHDDITRQAAARALGSSVSRDDGLVAGLRSVAARHADTRATSQVYVQADVLEGARVLPAVVGTAPGQVVPTPRGSLVLLPGPPREMRPLLADLVAEWGSAASPPAVLRCHGVSESDLQMVVQDVLGRRDDIELTVLARPGDVQVVLFDRGAGPVALGTVAAAVAQRIGEPCYSTDGASLPEVVVRLARARGVTLSTAESCTGGLVAGAITSVPGASDVYGGGIVSYADDVKIGLLGVDPGMIEALGAVSDAVALAMAAGARDAVGADVSVAVTGIAGPGGATARKPVGTVWFAVAGPDGTHAEMRSFPGDRETVRARSVMTALDLVRRSLLPG